MFETIPLNVLFEDLADSLASASWFPNSYRRVINIGLTFNNFSLSEICQILRSIFRKGDQVLAASELLGASDEDARLAPYRTEAAKQFNFLPLKALGFSLDQLDYFVRIHVGRIEMGFEVQESHMLPTGETVVEDSEIITSASYRYTEGELRSGLHEYFSDIDIYRTRDACSVCLITME